tara:strand:- start:605 stop:1468 length:864 start_codon:yes stop_codon:yes gene_type:complete
MYKYYLIFFLTFASSEIKAESQEYKFSNWSGKPISVYVTKPRKINSSTRLVVVMHGRKRNAKEYRNQWIEASKELNLLVVVPEFSDKNFPEVWGYNYGNVKTKTLKPVPKSLHAFSAIEPIVFQAIKKFNLKSNHWGIYGHGAGAHFVHRYVLYNPQSTHTLAIAANLGWYLTMTDKKWPFGLKNSDITDAMLKDSFDKYFLLMLGMSDVSTKPNTEYVASIFDKVTDQGKHRLERGRNFFNGVLSKSRALDTFLKWGMVEVPTKDGHSNTKQMVPFAAELFFERLK